MKYLYIPRLAMIGLTLITCCAQAGVIIGGTRIIYNASEKDATITLTNPDSHPYLIQSWVDNVGNEKKEVPFIITPPLYRLNTGKKSMMRIIYTGGALPGDKESLFFFNIKAIPSSAEVSSNVLQVVVKNKMKLLYRPASLKGKNPEDLAGQLQWQVSGSQLSVKNPTPFYMNFGEVRLNNIAIKSATWVAPYSTVSFTMSAPGKSGDLSFKLINDYGGLTQEFKSRV